MSQSPKLHLDAPLLLVGAGKMGGALLSGWIARGLDPSQVIVVDPAPAAEITAFLDSIAQDKTPPVTGYDGRRALALAVGVLEKIETHRAMLKV